MPTPKNLTLPNINPKPRKFGRGRSDLPPGKGRIPGSHNKVTTDIKNGVIEGLARHGSDGEGEGGFPGFIFFLAQRHPKQACRLVERLLPPSVVTGVEAGTTTVGAINIVQVPSGQHLSVEDCVRYSTPAALRLQIEGEVIESSDAEPEPDAEPDLESLSMEELMRRAGVSDRVE